MLPTLTPQTRKRPDNRPPHVVDRAGQYERRSRTRAHTRGTLDALRRATAAPDRRQGLSKPPAPAGLSAAIPAWSSRRNMLTVLRALARQPHVIALCKTRQVALDTWLAIAINDALDADSNTGRDLQTSQLIAGARVNKSERTVRRARSVSVQLGILIEVYRGRELTRTERLDLIRSSPGHKQRGYPNTYAVTVCPPRQRHRISIPGPGEYAQVNPHGQRFVHLPPLGGFRTDTHLLEILTFALADAQTEKEPPPAAQPRRKRRPGLALAHDVCAHPRVRSLFGVAAGTLAAQLGPYQHGGWQGHQLAAELFRTADLMGINTWEPAHAPHALLKTLLSRIDPVADVHLATGLAPEDEADTHYVDPHTGEVFQTHEEASPCTHPQCDGFGFTKHEDGSLSRCAHCGGPRT